MCFPLNPANLLPRSYDPFGCRLSKTAGVFPKKHGRKMRSLFLVKDAGNRKTYYLYSAEGLIAEADGSGQLTQSYGYAPSSTFTTNPLWMKTTTQTGTPVYYTYQNDHLGTPQKLLNQSGAVVWSATYDAFGKASVDAASIVTNNLRYPGQYADQETGLHYNWNRYYDPKSGRYTTSDPIGLKGGINTYSYVDARQVNWIDPYGLNARTIIKITKKAICTWQKAQEIAIDESRKRDEIRWQANSKIYIDDFNKDVDNCLLLTSDPDSSGNTCPQNRTSAFQACYLRAIAFRKMREDTQFEEIVKSYNREKTPLEKIGFWVGIACSIL